ncbi:MAG: hypothetical protein F4Z72_15415 [Gemmatimonadales bacterium]|nr:hypothetical protein [Candidatus Palauibacter irciniicola]MYC18256.1 hypothetical protein [Gemmatimonadales bacterium]
MAPSANVSKMALLPILAIATAIGCGGGDSLIVDPDPVPPPNRAPETTGAIPAQSLAVGMNVTVNLSPFFRDPDGDALTYSAASSDTLVAEAAVSGERLILVAVSRGAASATVTAADGRGGEAHQSFSVTVPNSPPMAAREIASRALAPGGTETIDLSGYFIDPEGDPLTYSATSSDTLVAEAAVSGTRLILIAVSRGAASATVTASDGMGGEAHLSFSVAVSAPIPNAPPIPVGAIRSRTIAAGSVATMDVSRYFSDADGDALTYGASSSDARVAWVSVSGSELAMVGLSPGVAAATVNARDPEGAEARQSFELAVCAVPAGILHWWSAEGSGADRIGGVDATLMSGATYARGVVGATGGEAFSFDGVDALAVVSDAPTLNPEGPFTVMAWARPGRAETAGSGAIIGKGHPWMESWVLDNHNGRWRTFMRDRDRGDEKVYGPRLVPGEWTHLAMTWDGDRLALYVDAVEQGTRDIESIHVTDAFVGIGGRSEEGFQDGELDFEFTGEIDEVMFFGRALGVEEIRSVFENAAIGFCNS